ncbi:unknown protein [Seminavis robusta]|uniref:Uncharacterized protein n=1 Tax=Seminavis robusta TaxID=568900 RepID=A0A9N8EXZ8_9STRA|nr:unknown protein [Seminavis robusta]|eukprot:Sro2052_g312620.1 n/a (662) ;mRNA; f:13642-15698
MGRSGVDWTTYRLNGKAERFIRIGVGNEVELPNDMYDREGSLTCYPVEEEHKTNFRTKSEQGCVPKLLEAAADVSSSSKKEAEPTGKASNKQLVMDLSPKTLLLGFFQELVEDAAKTGIGTVKERSARKLKCLMEVAIEVEAKELLHEAVATLEMGANKLGISMEIEAASPKKNEPSVKEPQVVTPTNANVRQQDKDTNPPVTDQEANVQQVGNAVEKATELEEELEDDEKSTSTADEFILELQEEVLLQSLLHKQIHEKKERVFTMEHKNGRRLLVVLPPDTRSVAKFEEEAKRTNWVNTMLNTEERMNGMLSYLAKTSPKQYAKVGTDRKIKMRPNVLNTAQTVALARVGNLNDVRMKKVKSFLKNVGKVNLIQSTKEMSRIDTEVGLKRTMDVMFGSCVYEWSKTKGKEKKAPEEIHYWNASLFEEIEAEVDIHLKHRFLQESGKDKINNNIPLLDYKADGFDKPGVTILFGGDHSDKNCPISAKLNFASPVTRKTKKMLGNECPVIQFASVQCSKDAYYLMETTVMPTIKQQLIRLKESSVVTVFHKKNCHGCYRSFVVPSSIQEGTIGFLSNQDNTAITMTYAHGGQDQSTFGSLVLKEPFIAVPYYELGAKVVIGRFNELFIGDLAFLAMLIGMNGSSGAHCLLCQLKGISVASQ